MRKGRYGRYGGQYVSEILMPALIELEEAYERIIPNTEFQEEYQKLLKDYGGRPTPLYHAERLSEEVGCRVYLKREDLVSGGSHKLNNTLGQALLAKKMGKRRVITETAAGQHGIATIMAAKVCGLEVQVFMGVKDIRRQASNVRIMKLLGAEIVPVDIGNGVLKDAVSDTLREWASCSGDTLYLMGSTVGPHPFPLIVADFQSVIGKESKQQFLEKEKELPDAVIAAGSGGSNALGMFKAFTGDKGVRLYFIEGGGEGLGAENSAAAFQLGRPGIIHGALMQVLQDAQGQVMPSKTRSAGLNYPARGPEISHLCEIGRVKAGYSFDVDVFDAVVTMAKMEGMIPALETAHAVAYMMKHKEEFENDAAIILNYSGRGDKDIDTIMRHIYGT